LTWLCTKASQPFSGTFGTFSRTSLNLNRRLHQCTPELFWAEDPISLRCWGIIYIIYVMMMMMMFTKYETLRIF
jgi:hypothetical protein